MHDFGQVIIVPPVMLRMEVSEIEDRILVFDKCIGFQPNGIAK